MTGHDWKIIRDGFVAALVAFATIGGVGGLELAAEERPLGLASEGRPEHKGSWSHCSPSFIRSLRADPNPCSSCG
ncbi:MAG TPA: hypothetical protein VLM40_07110, partial [Gemmata sp.]|nr:hypothetical protein [Gemmata sp.]